jgi:NAD+ kinase
MKIAFIASRSEKSQQLFATLSKRYTSYPLEEAEILVALGGDGFLLHVLHRYMNFKQPIYGINCGNLGFLLNNIDITQDIYQHLQNTNQVEIMPLLGSFTNTSQQSFSYFAFNEISIMRSEPVAANLQIKLNNKIIIERLVADGILISTPTGSTAYNRACGGPLISANSNLLAITPINSFNPLSWHGTTINNNSTVEIMNLETKNRTVKIAFDFKEHHNIVDAKIILSNDYKRTLLFDKNNDLESKILNAQFHQF